MNARFQRTRALIAAALVVLWGATSSYGQAPNWPSEFPPRPLPSRSVNFPPYQIQTLLNGLQVVVVLHHEQPVVSMRLLVRAGSAHDPKGKTGLARMLASLLDQGTTTQSAAELNDAIDFIGGAVGAGASSDLSSVYSLVMKDSFDTGLRMLSDMARRPAFAPEELERQRQQLGSSLRVSFDDPDFIANAVIGRLVYGFHPYGLPDSGTPETIAAITRDDIVAFHRKYFVPNNAILAIVGDVTADEAFLAARRVFGDWERRDVPDEKFADPPAPARRVVIVNKPDAVQTEVRVGHIGIPRNHPDYMALNLAVRILGGEGSNRLHQVLRTQRSLTYGAQADFDTLKESGDIIATTNTRSAATAEVLRLAVDEFWRLQRERVSERELADAKAYLAGSFPLTIETPNAIAMQVLNVIFYGLPVEQLQTFRERVNAVTVDDIQRVARTYLKPDRLSVVLVGDASSFASQLQGIGFGTFETIDVDKLDLTTVDFKRTAGRSAALRNGLAPAPRVVQAFRPAASAVQASQQSAIVPEEGARARELLDRVIAAKGGLDKLQAIKTIVAKQTILNQRPGGGVVETETTTYIEYPGRFRVNMKIPGGTFEEGFDGTRAWIKDAQGLRDPPDDVAQEFKGSLDRDIIGLLVAAARGSARVRRLPDVKTAAGSVEHALEVAGPQGRPVVLYASPDTLLITKQTYAAGRGDALVEESFSDYRAVDGVQVAFAAERRIGDLVVKRRVTDIKLNASIDPVLFKRPGS